MHSLCKPYKNINQKHNVWDKVPVFTITGHRFSSFMKENQGVGEGRKEEVENKGESGVKWNLGSLYSLQPNQRSGRIASLSCIYHGSPLHPFHQELQTLNPLCWYPCGPVPSCCLQFDICGSSTTSSPLLQWTELISYQNFLHLGMCLLALWYCLLVKVNWYRESVDVTAVH